MNQRVLFVVVSDLLWYCMVSVIRMVLLTLEKRDCMALVLEGPKEVLSANSPTQSVLKGETWLLACMTWYFLYLHNKLNLEVTPFFFPNYFLPCQWNHPMHPKNVFINQEILPNIYLLAPYVRKRFSCLKYIFCKSRRFSLPCLSKAGSFRMWYNNVYCNHIMQLQPSCYVTFTSKVPPLYSTPCQTKAV